ncbi:MAG: hypothetical protein ACFFAY_00385 [Promethearchaeota archaeon]
MKRRKKSGFIMIACILFLPAFVVANNQGLRWAVQIGNRHEFSFTFRQVEHRTGWPDEVIAINDEAIYFEVVDLPTIPDNIQYVEELVYPEISLHYENGTPLSLSDSRVHFAYIDGIFIAPVGNWQLLTSLPSNMTTTTTTTTTVTYEHEVTRIDNLIHWGWTSSYSDSWSSQNITQEYYKSDGVLGYLSLNITAYNDFSTLISFERLNPPSAIGLVELSLIIGGAAAVVIVAIIIIKRKT